MTNDYSINDNHVHEHSLKRMFLLLGHVATHSSIFTINDIPGSAFNES
jgi:hypothetical protein